MLEVLRGNRRWLFARGAAALAFGILVLAWPNITPLALILLAGVYALADGAATLLLALRGPRTKDANVWPLVLVGLLGVLLAGRTALYWAGYMAFLWPRFTVVAPLIHVAVWAVLRGVFDVVAAMRLRRDIEGEWLLGLAGLISIAWGVALLLQPTAGLATLVWHVAVYALFAGILYIALGLRLRHAPGYRHATP